MDNRLRLHDRLQNALRLVRQHYITEDRLLWHHWHENPERNLSLGCLVDSQSIHQGLRRIVLMKRDTGVRESRLSLLRPILILVI